MYKIKFIIIIKQKNSVSLIYFAILANKIYIKFMFKNICINRFLYVLT